MFIVRLRIRFVKRLIASADYFAPMIYVASLRKSCAQSQILTGQNLGKLSTAKIQNFLCEILAIKKPAHRLNTR